MNNKRHGRQGHSGNTGPGGQVWDSLNGLSAAVGGLTNITATLIPYLRDKDLMDKVVDRERLMRLAATLDRDIRASSNDLQSIRNQHAGRRGTTTNQTEWMQAVAIQEQYIAWAASFDDIIIPTFADLVEMIQEAGGNVSNIRCPSANAVVDSLRNNS